MNNIAWFAGLISWLVLLAIFLITWWDSERRTNANAVDAVWALGIGVMALSFSSTGAAPPARRALVAVMVSLWSLRLGGTLLLHRVFGVKEDRRYRSLRERWGTQASRRFLVLFCFQALLVGLLSLPFALASANPSPSWHWLELGGLLLFALGLVGELVADRQLRAHRTRREEMADRSTSGATCRQGLWRYSRHPNYFFEWLIWCAFALIATPSPSGLLAWTAPAIMLFLILRVTGIPPVEELALAKRGDDYREYQRTTSAFFPWFPKESANS